MHQSTAGRLQHLLGPRAANKALKGSSLKGEGRASRPASLPR